MKDHETFQQLHIIDALHFLKLNDYIEIAKSIVLVILNQRLKRLTWYHKLFDIYLNLNYVVKVHQKS
jgi:hypothetical protein